MTVRILIGDCRERMAELGADSIDSAVTDPPYHLTSIVKRFGAANAAPAKVGKTGAYARASKGFMGQTWDGGDVAFDPETWAAVYRVLKPGAHLVAFSGTRTYHRMACAIEDAGFEIRDQLAWVYGSGFPKSHNQPGGWGTALKPSQEPLCLARKPWTNQQEWVTIRSLVEGLWSALWWTLPANDAVKDSTLNPRVCGVDLSASAQWPAERLSNIRADLSDQMDMSRFELALTSSLSTASSWSDTLAALCRAESTSTTSTETSPTTDLRTLRFCLSKITPESIILAHRSGRWSSADACNATRYLSAQLATFAATLELSALGSAIERDRLDSLGVGAKPLSEPICLARKPLIGSVAANIAAHGTGAINIDGCRIEADEDTARANNGTALGRMNDDGWQAKAITTGGSPLGRWPANIIHDGSDEVLAGFPDVGVSTGGSGPASRDWRGDGHTVGAAFAGATGGFGDSGSAARFFYCAKATSAERGEGNNHPTVKPVDLMRWLCRLVTPKGGTVLDPFSGSGSTLIAADAEQFNAIGCELSPEYAAIAERRVRDAAGMFAEVLAA